MSIRASKAYYKKTSSHISVPVELVVRPASVDCSLSWHYRFRHGKFHDMVTTSDSGLIPEKLPPTEGAVKYHSLRAHLQIVIWKTLSTTALDALKWGWEVKDGKFVPIATDTPVAPDSLLKFIRCNCKKDTKNPCSTNRCSCMKFGLKCVAACGDCRGEHCRNVKVVVDEDVEDDDSVYEK